MPDSFLAEFEMYVLLSAAALADDAYGAAMRRDIEDRAGRPVSIGALYATLGRLEEKGLVALEARAPEEGQRGRPRKYCSLTPEGRAALRHSTDKLRVMMEGVPWLGGASEVVE